MEGEKVPNQTVSELVAQGENKMVTWTINDLFVSSNAGCLLQIEDPKVIIRFSLRPFGKTCQMSQKRIPQGYRVKQCYSLFAEVKQSPPNLLYRIMAQTNMGSDYSTGVITPTKSKDKALEAVKDFIHLLEMDSETASYYGKHLCVTIYVNLYSLNESGTGTVKLLESVKSATNSNHADEEVSLFGQLKAMYAAEDNYSDLKLESKDHLILPAHKFQLAARSPYFGKLIDDAIKKGTFGDDGTLKIGQVNGKPLMMILYWIYTGELNEKVGKFMEEVVDAAIRFELTGLMKICNKDNMFRLYKVAQRNGMLTAVDDISAFIRQNV